MQFERAVETVIVSFRNAGQKSFKLRDEKLLNAFVFIGFDKNKPLAGRTASGLTWSGRAARSGHEVRLAATQALSTLDPLEREVVDARFGLEGHPIRSMKQLRTDLGVDRADLRSALGSGLAKLRTTLQ